MILGGNAAISFPFAENFVGQIEIGGSNEVGCLLDFEYQSVFALSMH